MYCPQFFSQCQLFWQRVPLIYLLLLLQCLSKLKYSFDLSNAVCMSLCFNYHNFLPAWMVKVLQLLNIFPTLMWEGKDHLSWPSSEVITLPNASQVSINLCIFIYVFFSCYLLKIFCNVSDSDLTLVVWKCMDFVYLRGRWVEFQRTVVTSFPLKTFMIGLCKNWWHLSLVDLMHNRCTFMCSIFLWEL